MINKAGREIPDEILARFNKEGFKGSYGQNRQQCRPYDQGREGADDGPVLYSGYSPVSVF